MQDMENDELAQYLESLKRESCYRVDATLKQSDHEVTQRVYFEGSNSAESGPYIRKFIREGAGLGAAYLRIFEAQRAGKRFRHLPDILDCYSREGQLVVIMEYVQGDTLQEIVDRDGPSTEFTRRCFPQVCNAVEELHKQFDPPIIHRDLKPSNIILTGQEIVLIDFGISREYREESENDTHHFGTREYAPPEQFGFGQTGVYSDVYALGIVLFFCLTGRIPTAQDRTQGYRNASIPKSLRAVVAQAVELDPAERFASTAELKRAFLNVVPDEDQSPEKAIHPHEKPSSPHEEPDCPHEKPSSPHEEPDSPHEKASSPPNGRNAIRRRSALVGMAVVLCAAVLCAIFVFSHSATDNVAAEDGERSAVTPNTTADNDEAATEGNNEEAGAAGVNAGTSAADGNMGTSAADVDENTGTTADADGANSNTSTQSNSAYDMKIQAPARNGFDDATNFSATITGVAFQIPECFRAHIEQKGNDITYYYAETGSSSAMIMIMETPVESADIDVSNEEQMEGLKDSYLYGYMQPESFEELDSYADCLIAGYPGRIATVSGHVLGIPTKMTLAFFYNPDLGSIGSVTCGQTTNARYDYSDDFAKVIASASRAK